MDAAIEVKSSSDIKLFFIFFLRKIPLFCYLKLLFLILSRKDFQLTCNTDWHNKSPAMVKKMKSSIFTFPNRISIQKKTTTTKQQKRKQLFHEE